PTPAPYPPGITPLQVGEDHKGVEGWVKSCAYFLVLRKPKDRPKQVSALLRGPCPSQPRIHRPSIQAHAMRPPPTGPCRQGLWTRARHAAHPQNVQPCRCGPDEKMACAEQQVYQQPRPAGLKRCR